MKTFLTALLLTLLAATSWAADKPNILFILVDDLGWTDLGCYGHPWHETPNIDRLAEQGMRFTQAYAPAPICSASRASILTGKSTARLGFEFVTKDKPGEQRIIPPQPLRAPAYNLQLKLDEATIAECLKAAGYETAFAGKWHLNPHHQRYLGWSPTHGPKQQGFDVAIEDFGSHPYSGAKLETLTKVGSYHGDSLTQKAVAYLKQPHSQPFFLMVSHFYVHTPVKTPSEWLRNKYAGKVPVDAKNRKGRVEYAAFLQTLDHHVGELLTTLDEVKLSESTLVVFFSDNGGHPEYVSNKPLRGSKWNLYEGGIRVPMLARWPGKTVPGSVSETPVIGYDLLPTFAAIAGKPIDESSPSIDGVNLQPLFHSSDLAIERALYWHFPYYHPENKKFGRAKKVIGVDDFAVSQTRPHASIRQGNHKLVFFDEDQRSELYDLSQDISEQQDLSGTHPETTRTLTTALHQYLLHVEARRATPVQ